MILTKQVVIALFPLILILSSRLDKKTLRKDNERKYGFIEKKSVCIDKHMVTIIVVAELRPGLRYDCEFGPGVCSFIANKANLHSGIKQTDFHDYFLSNTVDPTLPLPLNSKEVDEGYFVWSTGF